MAFFNEQRLENRLRSQFVRGYTSNEIGARLFSKAETILNESMDFQKSKVGKLKSYDIFLSHSMKDSKKIAGLKLELEDLGYSVYVDWINDPQLDRSKVTRDTALLLKERMQNCNSLIYAFSENSSESKWMPWELGYFDGIKGKVAVLPISNKTESSFQGTEYLGVYFYVTIDKASDIDKEFLWIRENSNKYVRYDFWLKNNQEPYIH